jgi:hypothetical protein
MKEMQNLETYKRKPRREDPFRLVNLLEQCVGICSTRRNY